MLVLPRRRKQLQNHLQQLSEKCHKIDEYFKVLNKVELVMKENETLRKKIFYKLNSVGDYSLSDNSEKGMSEMLKAMIECAKENATRGHNGNKYSTFMKELGSLFLTLGGRHLYNIMASNLPLPSISTNERFLKSQTGPVNECVFRFDELKDFLLKRNHPLDVSISLDATVVIQRAQYDVKTNQIVGLVPPLVSGVPVPNAFPALSADLMKKHFDSNKLSSVAFVVMAQPVAVNASAFCLAVYGSDNKFNANEVAELLHFIRTECARREINVRGICSDGDTRFLKTMVSNSLSPTSNKWGWLPALNLDPDVSYFQDIYHIFVKLKSRLVKPSVILPFGPYQIISKGHLVSLASDGKDKHELTLSCLNSADKMNVKAAEKMSSSKVTDLLEEIPACKATGVYLTMMRELKDCFMKPSMCPEERIAIHWKWIFVLRMWRKWIVETPAYSLCHNFLTLNCYLCIELNGLSMLLLVQKLRRERKPELFRPSDFTSQPCESGFRDLRAMSTFRSSQVTFSVLEMKQKVRKLDHLSNLYVSISSKVVFPSGRKAASKAEKMSISFALPDDDDIEDAVLQAFQKACKICKEFGIPVTKTPPPLSVNGRTFQIPENSDPEEDDIDLNTIELTTAENENSSDIEDLISSEEADLFEDLCVVGSGSLGLKQYNDVEVSPLCPFVKVLDGNGNMCVIKKSSFLWLLSSGDTRLSSDRLLRVQSSEVSQPRKSTIPLGPTSISVPYKAESVFIGDWCAFYEGKSIFIGRVEAFSYLSGSTWKNQQYSLLAAPTVAPKDNGRGVGCLCSWFTIGKRNLESVIMDVHGYYSIDNYICTLPRPKIENGKLLVSFSEVDIKKVK